MDDEEPPDTRVLDLDKFDILTSSLERSVDLCSHVLNWTDGFLNNYGGIAGEINQNNKLEYIELWTCLTLIHRSAIHMCNTNPCNFLPGDRIDIIRKIAYADRLQSLVHGRKALLASIPERQEIRGTISDGTYEFLDPNTAVPDY